MQIWESGEWPAEARPTPELVARAVLDLDRGSEQDRDVLLTDLLCAAWPSGPCQDQ